jgi:hypothetical protein
VRQPVFTFEAEILTDAPFEQVAARLQALGSPAELRSLKAFRRWQPVEVAADALSLRWERSRVGALEQGHILIRPDDRGAHLRLEGRLKGWSGFLLLGMLRWRTDRLLDRFVEDL